MIIATPPAVGVGLVWEDRIDGTTDILKLRKNLTSKTVVINDKKIKKILIKNDQILQKNINLKKPNVQKNQSSKNAHFSPKKNGATYYKNNTIIN
jgi:hypothetical protein